jgi:GTP-binding protein HflX
MDRFQLILDIFAERATTHRSKLQVELARLRYELPNARMLISLSKKEERAGWGGLGDYEDSYEQDIKKRISRIGTELKKADLEEEARRVYRHKNGFFIVSLAGYTNAGKSTLFNALVSEQTEEKDMFFTTLIPKTRALEIEKRRLLLTDTVGFIEDLPHFLVDAFRSTLEGIYFSDMILLVVDFSESVEHIRKKLVICHETLWEKSTTNIITVLNKTEELPKAERRKKMEALKHLICNPVFISAKTGAGLNDLKKAIAQNLPSLMTKTIYLPNNESGASALSWFYDNGIVDEILYGKCMTFEFSAAEDIIAKTDDVVKKADVK